MQIQESLNVTVKEASAAAAQESSQNSFSPISTNTSSGKLLSCVTQGFAELLRQVCISASLSHLWCRKDHHSRHRVRLDFSEGEREEPLWGEKFNKRVFLLSTLLYVSTASTLSNAFAPIWNGFSSAVYPNGQVQFAKGCVLLQNIPLLCDLIQASMKQFWEPQQFAAS